MIKDKAEGISAPAFFALRRYPICMAYGEVGIFSDHIAVFGTGGCYISGTRWLIYRMDSRQNKMEKLLV